MKSRMWVLVLCASVWLSAAPPVCAASAPTFAEANSEFQKGNFKEAAAAYEKIAAAGTVSAELYYNLGNAYFRIGRKGLALLNYERARRLAPRDKDLLWNLGVLKSVLADRFEPAGEGLTAYWIRIALEKISAGEAALALCAALAVFAMSGLMIFWLGPSGIFRLLQSSGVILVILATAVFAVKWAEVKEPRVVVVAKEVYARYGPSDKETRAFLLHEGAEVRMRDKTKGWCYVSLPNKDSGWIPGDACVTL